MGSPSSLGMTICQLVVVWSMVARISTSSRCQHREPEGISAKKVSGDNGFHLKLNGDPEKFIPRQTYTVRLAGDRTEVSEKKLSRFVLVSENTDPHKLAESGSSGNFQLLGDVLTRFSDHCTNTVTETSQILKDEIQVLWTAPPPGNGCVRFKAMVVEHGDVWSMDDSRLSLTLCEDQSDEEHVSIIQDPCCACEEAKYEVTFQGLWSKETHPKDFPRSEWLLHFSDIIGASHTSEYRVWEQGGYASNGLSQVAKWGSPRLLESELKAESSQIRTIIKARGLWQPNVNGKTFAIFRTDRRNHLVSLVSMLGPTPDWIVGVSALELCQANCTWLQEKEMFLYPWDAGVDSGISYESPDSPTEPKQPIKRITTRDPSDPAAPFYDPTGAPMKPLAKLTIQKQREYRKSCLPDNEDNPGGGNGGSELFSQYGPFLPEAEPEDSVSLAGCSTTPWSTWTQCSVTCGKGLSVRRRSWVTPADAVGCDLQLIQREMCAADVPTCEGSSSFYSSAPSSWEPDDMCAVTQWSDWSHCSVTCGRGFRARTRRFYNRLGRKKCPHVDTMEKKVCEGGLECSPGEVEVINPECAVTSWSDWSPCSVSCGTGLKVRTRLYRVSRQQQLEAGCSLQLMEKGPCAGRRDDCAWKENEYRVICSQRREPGPCRGAFQKWYFNSAANECQRFNFGGCRGNSNNFNSYEECVKVCAGNSPANATSGNLAGFQSDHSGPAMHARNDVAFGNSLEVREEVQTGSPMQMLKAKMIDNEFGASFDAALDVLARERTEAKSDGMTEQAKELEMQRQTVMELEKEKSSTPDGMWKGEQQLMMEQKKMMMMEKQIMMRSQMGMFKKKQMEMAKQQEMMAIKQKAMMMAREQQDSRSLSNVTLSGQRENQDCEVTAWSPWSEQCSSSCGRGFRHRFRSLMRPATGTGKPCPRKLERRKKCRLPPCLQDCLLTLWGSWGPCSATCGKEGTQDRHRQVLSHNKHGGKSCGPRLERRVCRLPCCEGEEGCYEEDL